MLKPPKRREPEQQGTLEKEEGQEVASSFGIVPSSSQVSPSTSSTSFFTCTNDLSYSNQASQSSSPRIIDIQRTAKRRNRESQPSVHCQLFPTSSSTLEPSFELVQQQEQRRSATGATTTTSRNCVSGVPTTSNQAINQALSADQQQNSNKWTQNVTTTATATATTPTPSKVSGGQKQQSGETLSSFESDYDLLVYLGETETEDIVDTERSLDYQDQTWRQSICGGASLAPTIDESLSELIGSNHNFNNRNSYQDFDLLNTPTVSPLVAHSPSPPRSASTSFQQQQPQRQPFADVYFDDTKSPTYSLRQPRQAFSSRQVKRAEVESDECDNEVSLVFKQRQQQQLPLNQQTQVKRLEQPKDQEEEIQQQQQQKLVGNIGNKLVSLFNRKQATTGNNNNQPPPVTEHELHWRRNKEFSDSPTLAGYNKKQEEEDRVKSRTLGARRELDKQQRDYISDLNFDDNTNNNRKIYTQDRYRDSELSRIKSASLCSANAEGAYSGVAGTNMVGPRQNNNESVAADEAAELDRLLAEMNQSLDLNSLARYDPINSSRFASTQNTRQGQPALTGTTQTLSKFHYQAASSTPPKSFAQKAQQPQQQQVFYTSNNARFRNVTPAELNFRQPNMREQQTLAPPLNRSANDLNYHNNNSSNDNTQASCESILDEYDGASRMLEQMITDQLVDSKKALPGNNCSPFKPMKNQQHQRADSPVSGKSVSATATATTTTKQQIATSQQVLNSSTPSGAQSASSRRQSKSSVIDKEEAQAATAIGSDQEHTSSAQEQSRKVSTCSSSMTNTDATSVVMATRVNELPANKRDLFENRSVWRHRRSTRSSGHTGTPPSGGEDGATQASAKAFTKASRTQQLSLDQPSSTNFEELTKPRALTSHSLESAPLTKTKANNKTILITKEELVKPVCRQKINGIKSPEPPTELTFSGSRRASSEAPTPPEVDYGDSDGAEVIKVEAVEIPGSPSSSSSDDQVVASARESQMNKMKRRTLTSMRSMRDRFTDFMGNNSAAENRRNQQQRSQVITVAPKPPKRSSSIGSQSSRGKQEPQQVVADETVKQEVSLGERESRSKRRGRAPNPPSEQQVPVNQASLGQQIRERLSRSKSRLSKFLRPAAKRAQSTPNTKQEIKIELSEAEDNKLFQPSDIARNCDLEAGKARASDDSFNESLDRHLAASLGGGKKPTATTTARKSSESSLSGLDLSKTNGNALQARSRSKKRMSNTMTTQAKVSSSSDPNRDQQQQPQARSKSLLSIKRLSSFRNKDVQSGELGQQQVEDFDSMKVSTSAKSGKRRRRNKKRGEKNKSSDEQSSRASPVQLGVKLSSTSDYFGQVAPVKADSHDESDQSSSSRGDLSKSHSATLAPPGGEKAPELQLKPKESKSDDSTSAKSSQLNQADSFEPKKPNRSQSLRCIRRANNRASANQSEKPEQVSKENRTSSFTNLNRRLPSSTNTFRPISACAKLDDGLNNGQHSAANEDEPLPATSSARLEVLTPVGPSNSPLSGLRLESTKPAQLKYQAGSRPAGGSVSPIRAKSAAVLDDIRHKCSEFFTSPGSRRRAPAAPSGQTVKEAPAELGPVRPPRKSGSKAAEQGKQRSKSLHAGTASPDSEAAFSDAAEEDKMCKVITAKAASPTSTLGEDLSPRNTPTPKATQNRLTAFAQHLRDTFQVGQGGTSARRIRPGESRPRSPRAEEPLCEWKPVIARSNESGKRSTVGLGVNKQLISQLGQTSKDGEHQQNNSLDTDTWGESSGDEDLHETKRTQITHDRDNDSLKIGKSDRSQLMTMDEQPAKKLEPELKLKPDLKLESELKLEQGDNSEDKTSNLLPTAFVGSKSDVVVVSVDLPSSTVEPANVQSAGASNNLLASASAFASPFQQPTTSSAVKVKPTTSNGKSEQSGELAQKGFEENNNSIRVVTTTGWTTNNNNNNKRLQQVATSETAKVPSNTSARVEEETWKERPIDVEAIRDEPENIDQCYARHNEQEVCRTPFKFNAYLPPPSQVVNYKSPNETSKETNDEDELVESLVKSDANLAALLNVKQEAKREEEMATIASYRPIRRPETTNTKLDEADASFLEAISHSKARKIAEVNLKQQEQEEDGTQKRLSVYENVHSSDERSPEPAQDKGEAEGENTRLAEGGKRERRWRKPVKPPPPAPIVCEKPPKLVFNQQKIEEAAKVSGPSLSPPDSPGSWSVEETQAGASTLQYPLEHSKSESQFIKEKLEKLMKADEENETVGQAPSPTPERKLVRMTSIIQEPNDELMVGAASSKQLAATKEVAGKSGSKTAQVRPLQRRDSAFSFGGGEDSDTDSSFAAANENRKRLLSKFEQSMLTRQDETNNTKVDKSSGKPKLRPKFPAFAEGRMAEGAGPSGSLVKRLAKNFDQTIQEQQPTNGPASAKKPPTGLHNKPQVVSRTFAPIKVVSGNSFDGSEDQKSESVWYDANSVEGLNEVATEEVDEAELAEFLREFDNDRVKQKEEPETGKREVTERNKNTVLDTGIGKLMSAQQSEDNNNKPLTVAELNQASEAGSVSSGVDPFVTVADSTVEDDAQGQAIDDQVEQVSANDDDNTLNDDEQLKSEAEGLTSVSESGSSRSGASNKECSEEQFVSVATTASSKSSRSPSADRGTPVAGTATLKDQQGVSSVEKQQQEQQQGNDKDNSCDAAKAEKSVAATSQPLTTNIPTNASVDELRDRLVVDESDEALVEGGELEYEKRECRKLVLPDSKKDDNNKQKLASLSSFKTTTATTSMPTTGVVIDNKFKNSLNNIIAQQQQQQQQHQQNRRLSSQQQQSKQETQSQKEIMTMTGSSSGSVAQSNDSKAGKSSRKAKSSNSCALARSKELKGLRKYYHALLRHSGRHKRRSEKKAEKASKGGKDDEYIHSSSESSESECESESEDEDDDSFSENESETGDSNRKLVRAAKNCSRLYEELERILANRAANAQLRKQAQSKDKTQSGFKVVEEEDKKTVSSQKEQAQLEDCEDDDELGDYYDETLSSTMTERDDQVSLSSSSVSSESIPEMKQRQNLQKLYHVVNEIYSSEAKFVDTLKLLNEDFRSFVLKPTQTSSNSNKPAPLVVPSEIISSILKHLPQLQALNENLLAELKLARDQWPRTQKIAHVLVKIGPFLKHYSTYIREFESIQQQLTESIKKYPQFLDRIKEFESSERSQKLTVQHHLLKPIQRIPQYRLLLQQYLHHLKPDDIDYEDTVNALEVVSRVAEHANQAMCEGANFAKLLALQAKIFGKQRDIVQPGRLFVKEGELLKVCRKQVQPRWFILLNDALLYLTQIQSSDILYLNNELPLDDCLVSIVENEEEKQQNNNSNHKQLDTEFTVSTKTRSFALIAKSRQERDDWVNVFKKTIDDHMARRRSFIRQPASLTSACQDLSNSNKPNTSQLIGQRAPLWTPDSYVTMCQLCTSSFSALFRRHHCRGCGRVVCSACSSSRAPLLYLKCRAARVCDECFEILKANIHLYYLPSSHASSIKAANNQTDPSGSQESSIKEEELHRLDEYFHTLLKSQFVRHVGLGKVKKLARNSSSSTT